MLESQERPELQDLPVYPVNLEKMVFVAPGDRGVHLEKSATAESPAHKDPPDNQVGQAETVNPAFVPLTVQVMAEYSSLTNLLLLLRNHLISQLQLQWLRDQRQHPSQLISQLLSHRSQHRNQLINLQLLQHRCQLLPIRHLNSYKVSSYFWV